MPVDLGKVQREAAFVHKALKHFGLPSSIGEAIAALARTIRDHKHLETLLTSCEAKDRQDLYDSVRPHLRFEAKPLDSYISSAGSRAEREQWPTIATDGTLQPFKPATDVHTLLQEAVHRLTVTCSKCLTEESFSGTESETRVDVILKARVKGWVYEPQKEQEICPKCAKKFGYSSRFTN